MPRRKNIKVYTPPPPSKRARAMRVVEESFHPLKTDKVPDFYDNAPRTDVKLSPEQCEKVVAALSLGFSHEMAIRCAASLSPIMLRPMSQIAAGFVTAARNYIAYLGRHDVTVRKVRNGQYGMSRLKLADTLTKIAAAHEDSAPSTAKKSKPRKRYAKALPALKSVATARQR